jgi:hypothetical protein
MIFISLSLSLQLETVYLLSYGLSDLERQYTRWFKYDRDYLCVNKSQFVPVIFEPPCTYNVILRRVHETTDVVEEQ